MVNDGSRMAAPPAPELLYLLHGDPTDLSEALAGMRAADVADALRELGPDAGSKVMAALPFDLAVQVFDEPELDRHRAGIVRRMAKDSATALIEAMSADQRADLFRELQESDQPRIGRRQLARDEHVRLQPELLDALVERHAVGFVRARAREHEQQSRMTP